MITKWDYVKNYINDRNHYVKETTINIISESLYCDKKTIRNYLNLLSSAGFSYALDPENLFYKTVCKIPKWYKIKNAVTEQKNYIKRKKIKC